MSEEDNIHRTHLPIPDQTHVGLTTYDAKDPDIKYPPIRELRPPKGAPNVRKCPPSQRNTVRHHSGMLSAFRPESCPSWPGTRTSSDVSESQYSRICSRSASVASQVTA
jgi:hypothetical protein